LKEPISTDLPAERAFLVGVQLKHDRSGWDVIDSLEELAQLSSTAHLDIVGQTYQRLDRIDPATYIGKGKLEEIQGYLVDLEFDLLVFDDELSPRQQRNIEETLAIRVLDRTALILDIFAQHARTREGALQVELAQYEYLLPRLTHQWAHLGRQVAAGGGRRGKGARGGAGTGPGSLGAGMRGPGETQLETDRREIRHRIAHLKQSLEDVRHQRGLQREQRRKTGIPTVALVGYTNAGKSTLLNALTGTDALVVDQLFATLDPLTRRVTLPSGKEALLTDTVGFIKKLPTTLVAAFRATLEEVVEADVLLHVVDISHEMAIEQSLAVESVLEELGAADRPMIVALNKVDKLPASEAANIASSEFPGGVAISAAHGEGLEVLLSEVEEVLQRNMVSVRVKLPYHAAELVALFHQQGSIESEQHAADGTTIRGFLPEKLLDKFQGYFVPAAKK
jgi:GTPase